MRRCRSYFAILLILSIVLLLQSRVSFATDRFHRFTMDNGARVILKENRATPVVSLQIWMTVGSGDEKDDEAGMCHFIEHMIFKGTEKRKVRQIAREVESMGGMINAYTSYDQTVYHLTIASRYALTGLDILSDAIQHSTFDASELEKEREVVLEEIRMGEDDPSRKLFKQTMATVYQRHPYRRPVVGYEKTVKSFTRDQMVAFFKRWYVPNRMVFVVVGDFDLQEMEGKVREAFKDFTSSAEKMPSRIEEIEAKKPRTTVSYGNYKETYLQIAVPIPSVTDEDTPALDVIAQILGGGEASRLVQKVKLEKGLVNSISASSYTPKDRGAFIIGVTLPAENLENAVKEILREVIRLGHDGVTAEEVHRVRVNVESGLIYDRQTVQGEARKMGYYEAIAGDVQFEKEYMRRIALLQSEDIQKAVAKYFETPPWVVSLLAPSEKADLIKSFSLQSVLDGLKPEESLLKKKEKPSVSKRVLKNGIRLIVKENRAIPLVTLQASFLGGVRFEKEANNGINHLIAILLTKGTANQTSLDITKKVERMAGSLSGFSGYNSFGLTFTFLSQHFEEALNLFTEVIKQPSFDPQEIEKRKRLILAAIRQQEDYLDRLVFKLFRKTLYQAHPYRMDVMGTIDSVERLTQKDLREYYQKIVVPENMVLTVVGDVDEEQAALAVEKGFEDLKRGTFFLPSVPQEQALQEVRKAEVFRTKEQAHFVLGFLGTTLQDRDRYALEVLDAALSGMGGRLFYELRDKESLAYALSFTAQTNLDRGWVGVYMATHPEKLEAAISGTIRLLKKVKEEGLTEAEVEAAKKYLIGNFEIGLQTNGAQANHIAFDELYGLGFDFFQKYPAHIEKVSREDIQRVMNTYFNFDVYAIAVVRPPPGSLPVEKKK